MMRYDAHLFVRELGKKFNTCKIGVIAENKEKYISLNVDVIVDSYTDESGEVKEKKIQRRFIDSMRFMASSLDSLTNNLVKFALISSTCWDKFNETEITPKETFHSNLDMRDISDQDYSHTQKV